MIESLLGIHRCIPTSGLQSNSYTVFPSTPLQNALEFVFFLLLLLLLLGNEDLSICSYKCTHHYSVTGISTIIIKLLIYCLIGSHRLRTLLLHTYIYSYSHSCPTTSDNSLYTRSVVVFFKSCVHFTVHFSWALAQPVHNNKHCELGN